MKTLACIILLVGLYASDGIRKWHLVIGNNGHAFVIEKNMWGFGDRNLHHLRISTKGWQWSSDMSTWAEVPRDVIEDINGAETSAHAPSR